MDSRPPYCRNHFSFASDDPAPGTRRRQISIVNGLPSDPITYLGLGLTGTVMKVTIRKQLGGVFEGREVRGRSAYARRETVLRAALSLVPIDP